MPPPVIDTDSVIAFMSDGWWAGGSSAVITYSTGGTAWGSDYGPGDEPTNAQYGLLNATQRTAFVTAMELWDSYVAAEFNLTTEPGAIRAAFTDIVDEGVWGYAYLPAQGQATSTRNSTGDIWIGHEYKTSNFAVGSYDFEALMHEIGHALGLDHSFRENGEPASEGLPVQYDTTRYSIMSYTAPADGYTVLITDDGEGGILANFPSVQAITPMLFDILVIQDLYGVSTTTRTGATSYSFDANVASFQTIFDSSGVDTWNLAGHARRSSIDLRAGSFSSIDIFTIQEQIDAACVTWGEGYRDFFTMDVFIPTGATFTWENNVAIAYSTTIENVICGNNSDSVVGNNSDNSINGGKGNDVLLSSRGNDTVSGGAGADKLNGGDGQDTLTGGAGRDNFLLNSAAVAANSDTITDFTSGQDRIQLENSVFTGLGATVGVLSSAQFWAGANAHDADDRIIYNFSSGALYYDADGNGSGGKVIIATLTGAPTLLASDIYII